MHLYVHVRTSRGVKDMGLQLCGVKVLTYRLCSVLTRVPLATAVMNENTVTKAYKSQRAGSLLRDTVCCYGMLGFCTQLLCFGWRGCYVSVLLCFASKC